MPQYEKMRTYVFFSSNYLWCELVEFGYKILKEPWHESTLSLLNLHWTEAASAEWNKIKKHNIEKLNSNSLCFFKTFAPINPL